MEARLEQQEPDRRSSTEENTSTLKGTLVSVLFIGGFLLVTWFSIFFLFLSRN